MLLVAALAIAVAGISFRLGAPPVTRSSEERCYAVSTTMLESGDWLVPVYQGEPRLQKPPMYYWLAATSGWLLGGMSRTAERLPSLLCALGTLVVVFAWGRSLGGTTYGLVAALILVSTYGFWRQARRGDAEMLLAFTVTTTLYLLDRSVFQRSAAARRACVAFAGAALLAKATMALVLIGVPALVLIHEQRRWSDLRSRGVWTGIAIAIAIGLAWYSVVALCVPGAVSQFRQATLVSLGTPDGESATHYQPSWYYLAAVLSFAVPAAALLPLAVHRWRETRGWASLPRQRFLVRSSLALFVALTLLPQKQRHYLLPLLPLLSLALADAVHTLLRTRLEGSNARRIVWCGRATALAAVVAAGLTAFHLRFDAAASFEVAAAAAAVFWIVAAYAWVQAGARNVVGVAVAVAVTTVLSFVVYFASVETVRFEGHGAAAARGDRIVRDGRTAEASLGPAR